MGIDFELLWGDLQDRISAVHESTLIEKERILLGEILNLMNILFEAEETRCIQEYNKKPR